MKENDKRIIGLHGIRERQAEDYYATDPQATKLFLDNYKLKGDKIWEPSCGEGHMSKVIKERGYNVYSSDLIDRGYGDVMDFFESDIKVSTIITNPPFKHAKEFVEHALTLADKQVIMLLKLQFLESERRRDFFKNTPLKEVWVHSKRIVCWKNGEPLNEKDNKWAGTQAYAWFVWEQDYDGEPVIKWL